MKHDAVWLLAVVNERKGTYLVLQTTDDLQF